MARTGRILSLTLVLAALLAGSGIYHFVCMELPWRQFPTATKEFWINRSDLYPSWYGARASLLEGRNPYSDEVADDIQRRFYGFVVTDSTFDQGRFAYPLTVVVFLIPTVFLPFVAVRVGFTLIFAACAASMVKLWANLIPQVSSLRAGVPVLTAVFLASWPVIYALGLTQLTIVAAFLLALCGRSIAKGRLFSAGVALALATFKPQLCIFPAIWILLWCLGGLRNRRMLLGGFVSVLVMLLAGAEFLLPGWQKDWLHEVALYKQYTNSRLLLQHWTGLWPGLALTLALSAIVLVQLWKSRRAEANSTEFAYSFVLAVTAGVVITPTAVVQGYNELLLLPAVMWLGVNFRKCWEAGLLCRLSLAITAFALAWEPVWVLLLAILGLAGSRAPVWNEQLKIAPHLLFLALPVFVLLSLMLSRRVTVQTDGTESARFAVAH